MTLAEKIKSSFSNKDINTHLECFKADAVGYSLKENKTEFSSHGELKHLLIDLFRVNPDLKAEIKFELQHGEFYTFHLHLYDFVCGAKTDTIWNCKIRDQEITQLWFT